MIQTYTKIEPSRVKENRTFYKNRVRTAFICWCAYEGYLDGVLTPQEVKKAKKGQLPQDLNIHHKMPLSGKDEGVNEFTNLVIIHKNTHEHINKHVFSPQLKPYINAPYGTQFEIDIPEFDFVDVNGIKYERRKEALEKQFAYSKFRGR